MGLDYDSGHDEYVERFRRAIAGLPALELEVVTRAAERVARGAHDGVHVYGPLTYDDSRDKLEEAAQEAGDGLFYCTWGKMQRDRPQPLQRDTDPVVEVCDDGDW